MSATLAVLLKELQPDLDVMLIEGRDGPAQESSNGWNNAGTGHAALCELNYTAPRADGTVDISRALKVNTQFDLSRQLWAYLVRRGMLGSPDSFIHPVPHISFVHGAENVAFLRARYEAMHAHHCFETMEYSEDPHQLTSWMPLVMEGRDPNEPVAATRIAEGTDVDFGTLTRLMISHLQTLPGFRVAYGREVADIQRNGDRWNVLVKEKAAHVRRSPPGLCSWARAAARYPCCRKAGYRKERGTRASRSAACGCAATTLQWPRGMTPKSTGKRRSAHRRCRCRTSIRA